MRREPYAEAIAPARSLMDKSMNERDAGLDALRTLADRADRNDLAAAQDILLQTILREDGAERRNQALDALLAEFQGDDRAGSRSQEQDAFRAVLCAMIERTREMAGARQG